MIPGKGYAAKYVKAVNVRRLWKQEGICIIKRAICVLAALVMTGSYSISAEELTSGEISAEQIESLGWPEASEELGGEDVRESEADP